MPEIRHRRAMKYLDDFKEGFSETTGSYKVTEDEIVAFARAYDPQPIHTDKAFAEKGLFGGLIASGWQSCGIAMRLLVDHVIKDVAVVASPGVDEIRWLLPVRPGDVLHLKWTIVDIRHSTTKPDRGIVRAQSDLINQKDETVMNLVGMTIVLTRPSTPN
jgi:acyl dehydratase